MRIVLPYPPTLNNMRAIFRGRLITTTESRRYHAAVGMVARAAGMRPIVAGPVEVRVWVYRPRKSGDLDNTLKAAFDGLKGIAWADDGQVVRIVAERFDDKHRPRLELEVLPLCAAPTALAAVGAKEDRP